MEQDREDSGRVYPADRDGLEQPGGSSHSHNRKGKARAKPTRDVDRRRGKVYSDDLRAVQTVRQELGYKVYADNWSFQEYLAERDRREQEGGPLMHGRIYYRDLGHPPMDVNQDDSDEEAQRDPAVEGDAGGSAMDVVADKPQHNAQPWKTKTMRDWVKHPSPSSPLAIRSPGKKTRRRALQTGKRYRNQDNTIKARCRDSGSLRATILRATALAKTRMSTDNNGAHHKTKKICTYPRSGTLETLHDGDAGEAGHAQAEVPLFIQRRQHYLAGLESLARRQ